MCPQVSSPTPAGISSTNSIAVLLHTGVAIDLVVHYVVTLFVAGLKTIATATLLLYEYIALAA